MSVAASASGMDAPSNDTPNNPGFDEIPADDDTPLEDTSVETQDETIEGGEQDTTPEPEALDLNRMVSVKIDGREQEVTLREALDGYQRQADYTRKTQELAERERSYADVKQLADAIEADPVGTINRLQAFVQQNFGTQVEDGQDFQPDPQAMRLAELERYVAEQREAQAEQQAQQYAYQLQQQLVSLQEQLSPTYGDYDLQDVVAYMQENQVYDPKAATAAVLFDRMGNEVTVAREREQAEQADRQRLDAKRNASPVTGAQFSGTSDAGGAPEQITSVQQAAELARRQLRGR